jgi:hypothetical protein
VPRESVPSKSATTSSGAGAETSRSSAAAISGRLDDARPGGARLRA